MVKITQHSFLGGQLDQEMLGRADIEKYRKGATELLNFVPTVRGALRKRPGTDFVADISDFIARTGSYFDPADAIAANDLGKFRLLPFSYTESRGYVIVLASCKARAYAMDGTWFDVSGDIPYSEDELDEISYCQIGDVMYIAHRNHPPAELRHEGDEAGGDAETSFVYRVHDVIDKGEVPTPTIDSAKVTRNHVDVAYRGAEHTEHYAASLVCRVDGSDYEGSVYDTGANAAWTDADGNPVAAKAGAATNEAANSTTTTPKSDDNYGAGSGTSKTWNGCSYFLPFTESQKIAVTIKFTSPKNQVRQVRLYKDHGGTYGLCAVYRRPLAASPSQRTITLEDVGNVPDTSVSPMEAKTVFASEGNYPGCVALYQQRLVWASSEKDPARIWMSQTGEFAEHRPHVVANNRLGVDANRPPPPRRAGGRRRPPPPSPSDSLPATAPSRGCPVAVGCGGTKG